MGQQIGRAHLVHELGVAHPTPRVGELLGFHKHRLPADARAHRRGKRRAYRQNGDPCSSGHGQASTAEDDELLDRTPAAIIMGLIAAAYSAAAVRPATVHEG